MSTIPVAALLAAAVADHQAGRAAEAEAGYRRVLAVRPDHPDALHLLGVLAAQNGHFQAAVELISAAIAVNDRVADFHANLARALAAAGNGERAISCYRRALVLEPRRPDWLFALGGLLHDRGETGAAVESYRCGLELEPGHAEACNGLGSALQELGQPAKAEAWFRRALVLAPDHVGALYNLAMVLQELDHGRVEEISALLTRALALAPGDAAVRYALGTMLIRAGNWQGVTTLLAEAPAADERLSLLADMLAVNRVYAADSREPGAGACAPGRGAGGEAPCLPAASSSIPPIAIFIKSFNRVFLVDRCLRSIKAMLTGYGRVVVLDDGSDEACLTHLQALHPEVEIVRSGSGARGKYGAVKRLAERLDGGEVLAELGGRFVNPAHFWAHEIGAEAGLAMVLEDDLWIDRPLDLAAVAATMAADDAIYLNLSAHREVFPGSPLQAVLFDPAIEEERREFAGAGEHGFIQYYRPVIGGRAQIPPGNAWFRRDLSCYLLRLIWPAAIIVDRGYYDGCFRDMPAWIAEWHSQRQALRQLAAMLRAGRRPRYGIGLPVIRKSFLTTCRLRLQDRRDGFFSFVVNDALSDLWRQGAFEVMDRFPDEIGYDTLRTALASRLEPAALAAWQRWHERIVAEYRSIGVCY